MENSTLLINIIASPDELMIATSTVEASNVAYIQLTWREGRQSNQMQIWGCMGRASCNHRALEILSWHSVCSSPYSSMSLIKSMCCEKKLCPTDCSLNIFSPFTLQICRVEDVDIYGEVSGSVVHIQRARNVTFSREGVLSASGLGVSLGART